MKTFPYHYRGDGILGANTRVDGRIIARNNNAIRVRVLLIARRRLSIHGRIKKNNNTFFTVSFGSRKEPSRRLDGIVINTRRATVRRTPERAPEGRGCGGFAQYDCGLRNRRRRTPIRAIPVFGPALCRERFMAFFFFFIIIYFLPFFNWPAISPDGHNTAVAVRGRSERRRVIASVLNEPLLKSSSRPQHRQPLAPVRRSSHAPRESPAVNCDTCRSAERFTRARTTITILQVHFCAAMTARGSK